MKLTNFAKNNARKGFVFNGNGGDDFSDMIPEEEKMVTLKAVKAEDVLDSVFGDIEELPTPVKATAAKTLGVEELVDETNRVFTAVNELIPPSGEKITLITPEQKAAYVAAEQTPHPEPTKVTIIEDDNNGGVRPGIIFHDKPVADKPKVKLYNPDHDCSFPNVKDGAKTVSMLSNMVRNRAMEDYLFEQVTSSLSQEDFYKKFCSGFYFELAKYLDLLVEVDGKCQPNTPEEEGYDPDLIGSLIFLGRLYYNKAICKGDKEDLNMVIDKYCDTYEDDSDGIYPGFFDDLQTSLAYRLKLKGPDDSKNIIEYLRDQVGDSSSDNLTSRSLDVVEELVSNALCDEHHHHDDAEDMIEDVGISIKIFSNISDDFDVIKVSYNDGYGITAYPYYVEDANSLIASTTPAIDTWSWLSNLAPDNMFWSSQPEVYTESNREMTSDSNRMVFLQLPITNGNGEHAVAAYIINTFINIDVQAAEDDPDYIPENLLDNPKALTFVNLLVIDNMTNRTSSQDRIEKYGIENIMTEAQAVAMAAGEEYSLDENAELAADIFKDDGHNIIAEKTANVDLDIEGEPDVDYELAPEAEAALDVFTDDLVEEAFNVSGDPAPTQYEISQTEETLEELGIADPAEDDGGFRPISKKDRNKKKNKK